EKQRKEKHELRSPFSRKWSPRYRFTLVKRETLWGRPAWVVHVTALDRHPDARDGTAWIDAERFVELRGQFVPAKLPDYTDWAKVQEQFTLHPSGYAVLELLILDGAGHLMVFKKGLHTTMRWSDCR